MDKNRYKKYDVRVQDYMKNIVNSLVDDFKTIPISWYTALDLIAMNADLMFKAKDDIDTNGLYHIDERQRTARNPMFMVFNQAQTNITRLITHMGVSPASRSKIKYLDRKIEADEEISPDSLLND